MALIETHPSRKLRAALQSTPDALRGKLAILDVLPVVRRFRAAATEARRLHRLRQMPEHLLRDIGLNDGDIAQLRPTAFTSTMDDSDSLRLR
ncbi:DUF1127 domain-containing protein [Neptunicoccus cionae]|uniref:DUF1127 domain-containing protein n=1 Tax=Neptunicoccus cionae TaxID=2035344 RepID=UPI000C79110F|nr:DUF1127 domain-containing protein [Amylibacter cionae]PLS23387.1 hypothetical protein C0U40_04475 [Amylibacter cionae]